MAILRFKKLFFRKPDGTDIDLDVPLQLNQELIKAVNFTEYSIRIMTTNRTVTEAEYAVIKLKSGGVVGYLIPAQALLSEQNPHITDKGYGAYNIIAAYLLCANSRRADYSLAHPDHAGANGANTIFPENCYYLVTWDKKIPNAKDFIENYSIFFSSRGLVFAPDRRQPLSKAVTFDGNVKTLRPKATVNLPSYVPTLLTELFPFTENPFLRFFYLYQVIEHLMAEDLDYQADILRAALDDTTTSSATELRDIINTFQEAAKEKPRIRKALQVECNITSTSAENVLNKAGINHGDMTFAEKIYKIRNTLFHDYQTLHACAPEMITLCDCLFVYLLEKRMPYSLSEPLSKK